MLRKIFLSILIILTFFIELNAQHSSFQQMVAIAWDVNIPINNKLIDATSYKGFKFEIRKMVKTNLSVGFEVGSTVFDQYIPRKTYQVQNGAVTTDMYGYIYSLPMALNVHHYFSVSKTVMPYIGIALGANYSEQKLYYNTYVSSSDNWGFLVRPEVGAIIKFQDDIGVLVGARYNYSTNSEQSFQMNSIQSLSFQLGFVFMK